MLQTDVALTCAQVCKEVFGDRLQEVVDIRGVHDWKKMMRYLRPRSADEDIQQQFRIELSARADASIDVRSKAAVSARVPWGPRYKILPFPGVPLTVLPASTQAPSLATQKPWPEFKAKVVPCLKRFYSRAYRHPVHIPPEEREEMLQFLQNGPAPPSAPAWIDWSRDIPQSEADAAAVDADVADQSEAPASGPYERAPTSGPAEIRRKKEWRPFLAPHERERRWQEVQVRICD